MPYKSKEDQREQKRRWRAADPKAHRERMRKHNLSQAGKRGRRTYALKLLGWTPEQYEATLIFQEEKCAICGAPKDKKGLRPDHDHVTGKARELLCYACNTGLGLFKDNTGILERAVAYLNKHKEAQHG